MKLIGLPGRNSQTEAWMTLLVQSLSFGQQTTSVAHYRHWDDSTEPDLLHEVGRLQIQASDLVVAKSFGTLVLLAYSHQQGSPSRAVFIGTPLKGYSAERIELLRVFCRETPSLFIQQTSDFNGSYAEVAAAVGDCAAAELVEIPGGDHVYADTSELATIIERWWSNFAEG